MDGGLEDNIIMGGGEGGMSNATKIGIALLIVLVAVIIYYYFRDRKSWELEREGWVIHIKDGCQHCERQEKELPGFTDYVRYNRNGVIYKGKHLARGFEPRSFPAWVRYDKHGNVKQYHYGYRDRKHFP